MAQRPSWTTLKTEDQVTGTTLKTEDQVTGTTLKTELKQQKPP